MQVKDIKLGEEYAVQTGRLRHHDVEIVRITTILRREEWGKRTEHTVIGYAEGGKEVRAGVEKVIDRAEAFRELIERRERERAEKDAAEAALKARVEHTIGVLAKAGIEAENRFNRRIEITGYENLLKLQQVIDGTFNKVQEDYE